jgi:hypothetical protein
MERMRRRWKLCNQTWRIGGISTGDIIATSIRAQPVARDAGGVIVTSI